MKYVGGLWIPDEEIYLAAHLRETPGYAENYDAALLGLALVAGTRRVAIDVGANVGLWSRRLADAFEYVHAFEPANSPRACFQKNVQRTNVDLHATALGDRNGTTGLVPRPGTTFKTSIRGSVGEFELRTLDSFGFTDVDFIKIDCEGADYYVLDGARSTILRERPVVLFEDKPGVAAKRYGLPQDAASLLLESYGYEVHHVERGNYLGRPKGEQQ